MALSSLGLAAAVARLATHLARDDRLEEAEGGGAVVGVLQVYEGDAQQELDVRVGHGVLRARTDQRRHQLEAVLKPTNKAVLLMCY